MKESTFTKMTFKEFIDDLTKRLFDSSLDPNYIFKNHYFGYRWNCFNLGVMPVKEPEENKIEYFITGSSIYGNKKKAKDIDIVFYEDSYLKFEKYFETEFESFDWADSYAINSNFNDEDYSDGQSTKIQFEDKIINFVILPDKEKWLMWKTTTLVMISLCNSYSKLKNRIKDDKQFRVNTFKMLVDKLDYFLIKVKENEND